MTKWFFVSRRDQEPGSKYWYKVLVVGGRVAAAADQLGLKIGQTWQEVVKSDTFYIEELPAIEE